MNAEELTITIIVPAYNEQDGLHDTLKSLLAQTVPAERIIVVDDCSTDGTPDVLKLYPVDVIRPEPGTGSKAGAQNYALPYCTTDLVLPVDADTVLAPDYIERIKQPFADPDVVIAAGNVQTKITRRVTERGRQIEYLFGFHYYRPIQNGVGAPVVCSGCCSTFRRINLTEFGGFPPRTIVEDMDYTWSQQIAGKKAVYVAGAECWAADPEDATYLKKQVNRWMSGFFQNVRIHWWDLIRHKKILALWVGLAVLEIFTVPVWWTMPVWLMLFFHDSFWTAMLWWVGLDLAVTVPVVTYAAIRRGLNPAKVLCNVPFVYFNKVINTYYAFRAMIVELILVPLGKSKGLVVYEKGR